MFIYWKCLEKEQFSQVVTFRIKDKNTIQKVTFGYVSWLRFTLQNKIE